jgi:hypothetical protein
VIDLAYQFEQSDAHPSAAEEVIAKRLSAAAALHPPSHSHLPRLIEFEGFNSRVYRWRGEIVPAGRQQFTSENFVYVGSSEALAVRAQVSAHSSFSPLASGNLLFNTNFAHGSMSGCIQTAVTSDTKTLSAYTTTILGTGTVTQATTSTRVIGSPAKPKQPLTIASKLAKQIDAARAVAKLEVSAIAIAEGAARDAKYMIQRTKLDGEPLIMFSDDGILTLQWQSADYGVAMLFAGDGEASIAFRKPGQLYAQNGIDLKITDDLPAEFRDVMRRIST